MKIALNPWTLMRMTLVSVATSFVLIGTAFAQDVSIFRIGESDLGHCTGFYVHGSKQVITAAHCNHRRDFKVFDEKGAVRADLAAATRSYITTSYGPFDILILGISDDQEKQLSDFQESVYKTNEKGFLIAGYPQKFRAASLSEFKCETLQVDAPYSQRGIEAKLGTTHVICPTLNHLPGQPAQQLLHADIAGLSGGPVFLDGRLVGLAYHYAQNGFEGQGYFKVQTLDSTGLNIMAESDAVIRFQVHRKIFEEIKLPNLINIQLATLLPTVLPKDLKRDMIQSMRLMPSLDLEIQFPDQLMTVPGSKVSPSLGKFLSATP